MSTLQTIIEQAFENRAEITPAAAPADVKEAVNQVIAQFNRGELRCAEKLNGGWVVNEWVK